MKFLHLSDLHIGKIVNDFSMLEEQQLLLKQVIEMAVANQVEAVVIAGDVYDRAVPSGEAVLLFDNFLTELVEKGIRVLMISGNHDSPERVGFGKKLFDNSGVHIAGVPEKELTTVVIDNVEFVLLPYVKPAWVGAATSQEAVEKLLKNYWETVANREEESGQPLGRTLSKDRKQEPSQNQSDQSVQPFKRVLVTHFFVTDSGREPELSDSETTIQVGGLDNVEAALFEGFDYVALGHIHKMQQIGERAVWYSGSPMAYSFGETQKQSGALLVTLGQPEGFLEVQVQKLELKPRRAFRKIKGSLEELLKQGQAEGAKRFDHIQAVLTDEGELIDPIGTLRSVYPNVMQILRAENEGSMERKQQRAAEGSSRMLKKNALDLFKEFYALVREKELSEQGRQIMARVVKELEE